MTYRTKTYIAGDWTGDNDAIKKLYEWNESNYWSLSFIDAHEITKANDTSLNCSIKSSLKTRMDASKKFVLIVGKNTNVLRAGSCQYCHSLNSYSHYCARGHNVDYRSFIEYECDMAVKAGIDIVVLYNYTYVARSKCPDSVKYIGKHIAMCYEKYGEVYWDYQAVKNAIG